MGHTYKISALNIKMHPHEPGSYISLLKDATRKKLSAQYYGDRHAMIGFFYPKDRNKPNGAHEGQIYSFLDINADDPWLDTLSAKAADDNDKCLITNFRVTSILKSLTRINLWQGVALLILSQSLSSRH